MAEIDKYLTEQFRGKDPHSSKVSRDVFAALKDNCHDKLGYIPLKPMALLHTTDKDSDIIKTMGCSDPEDLLTNNFGIMLSSCINTGADVQSVVVDSNGVNRTIHFQENQNLRMAFATETSPVSLSLGGLLRIGWGDFMGNPWNPTRSDFNLRDPFVTTPETNFFGVSTPVWDSGNQEVMLDGTVFNVTTSGTLGECGLFSYYRIGFSTGRALFMLSHDKTALPFSSSDNIKTTYTWSLS